MKDAARPQPRPSRLLIGSEDDTSLGIAAHYNPKEYDIAMQTNWADDGSPQGMVKDKDRDSLRDIQYTGAPARTMMLELFLDSYEPDNEHVQVETVIERLRQMASPRDEGSTLPQWRRPHICLVAWAGRRAFRGVIESMSVKYTMFTRDGVAVRAVCQLKLKEARLRSEIRGR